LDASLTELWKSSSEGATAVTGFGQIEQRGLEVGHK
jgi:hypothetical protein